MKVEKKGGGEEDRGDRGRWIPGRMGAPVAKEDELLDRDGAGAVVELGTAKDFGVERIELKAGEVD